MLDRQLSCRGAGSDSSTESGRPPAFFTRRTRFHTTMTSTIQSEIEGRLRDTEPDVDVLLAEVVGGRCLRVFIDHPDGVTLELCERVTMLLNDLRERYSLEV